MSTSMSTRGWRRAIRSRTTGIWVYAQNRLTGMNLGSRAAMQRQFGLAQSDVEQYSGDSVGRLSSTRRPIRTCNRLTTPRRRRLRSSSAMRPNRVFRRNLRGPGASAARRQNQAEGIAQQNLGNTLQNLATNIYGGNYEQERQDRSASKDWFRGWSDASFAPAAELHGYRRDAAAIRPAATATPALQNAENRYNWPFQLLGQLGAALPTAVGGAYTSQQTGPNPNAINPISGGLAGLLGVGGLLGGLGGGGGGMGGGLSALLGGLGSMLPF